jgi:outer membrane lipoprotein-sorting protein
METKMTKLIRVLIVFICTLVCAAAAFGQSADKIINQYQKAVGGVNQLRRIDSTIYTGTVTDSTDRTGKFIWRFKRPDRMVLEMDLSGFEVNTAYNGRSAWRRDSRDGLRTLTGPDGSLFKTEAVYRNDHFLDYKRNKTQVVSLGPATVNGTSAVAVELITRQGLKRKIYFDSKTFLILRDEQETTHGIESVSFGDYRKVDGILEPFAIEIKDADVVLKATISQVEHNRTLDETSFNFPKISNDPLPDIPSLLRELGKNQKQIDETLENYAYTEETVERAVNNKGEIVDKDSSTIEVSYYQGEELRRYVKKNGKALTPDEDEKENKRLEKRIHEIDDQKRKEAEKNKKREEAKARGEKTKEDEDPDLSSFLRICDFVNPRRERFRDRDVIVFDFQPKPGVKPKGFGEGFIQKLVGVMWVDEKSKEIARLEARLNDNMKMAGGLLATLKSGGAFVIEQDFINSEVWLPSYEEINISAKLFLFKGIDVNHTSRFSDYKKFKVDPTKAVVKDPVKEAKKP